MAFAYLGGVLIYVFQVPERLFPGAFDYSVRSSNRTRVCALYIDRHAPDSCGVHRSTRMSFGTCSCSLVPMRSSRSARLHSSCATRCSPRAAPNVRDPTRAKLQRGWLREIVRLCCRTYIRLVHGSCSLTCVCPSSSSSSPIDRSLRNPRS